MISLRPNLKTDLGPEKIIITGLKSNSVMLLRWLYYECTVWFTVATDIVGPRRKLLNILHLKAMMTMDPLKKEIFGGHVEKVSIVSPRKRTIKVHICYLWLVSSLWKEFHALEDDDSISIVFAFPSSTFLTYRWVVRHHQLSPRCNDKLNQAWTES